MLVTEPGRVDIEFQEIVAGLLGGDAGTADPGGYRLGALVTGKIDPMSDGVPREEDMEPWGDEEELDDLGVDWP
ncbi:hypothetical protein CDO52_02865 [Nocardiopsis gilva YIM 90087]|uniref:Uncharacterized protein n=1 Tax=Nocardiopsis gilva YIM 90087 TaxID=1235441 RepID=A0A223S1G8_9ACTN|nr:hypothetical protein [Nocardiopsis gilva]ASU81869.1 hypothetical protein CDO52_02865 [Nocardiopsis gilva YIM 90087]